MHLLTVHASQKNDEKFDGGPILDQIKSYLAENFATANLPKIVKPSHGMILVSLFFFISILYVFVIFSSVIVYKAYISI